MVLIVVYWLFLFFFILPFGILVKKGLKLKTINATIVVLLGLFLLTISFTVTAFFIPLNKYNFLACFSVCLFLYAIYWQPVKNLLQLFSKEIRNLTLFNKIIITAVALGAALKSAQLPFVIDNESYYIQTIKWVNEYGLVKGLANLHLFLAQASPWHIVHAGLNLNFTGITFNDINGFVIVLCILFSIQQTGKDKNKNHWLSLMPVFIPLFFLFADAPSPDLPLLVITPLLLYFYVHDESEDNFTLSFLLFLFIAFVKITIVPLGLIFLPRLFKNKSILQFTFLALLVAALWIIKNSIVSGYPLYPLTLLPLPADWTLPKPVLDTVNSVAYNYVYGTDSNASFFTKITSWLQLPGVKGLFNKLIIILFVLMPFFRKVRQDKNYRTAYIAFLIHFIILLFTSPQYRFFLPEIIFFVLLISGEILNLFNKAVLQKSVIAGGVLAGLLLLFSFNFKAATKNKFHQNSLGFQLSQVYKPEPVTRYEDMGFVKRKTGNLEYYSPETNFFLYGTADGPLPCVNKAQIDFIKQKTGYTPQIRQHNTTGNPTISEGFVSVKNLRE